ncbi:MAG: hypothetical protein ABI867_18210 [Kofleriaceae bacterium]
MAISKVAVFSVLGCVAFIAGMLGIVQCLEKKAKEPFDADHYLAIGMVDSLSQGKNVQLASIEITFVTPDGKVHTEHGGRLRMFFEGDGGPLTKPEMPGAPGRGNNTCDRISLDVYLDGDEIQTLHDSFSTNQNMGCHENPTVPGRLRCSVAHLWKRAIAEGAPNPAYATITLVTTKAQPPEEPSQRVWTFEIVDNSTSGPDKTLFSKHYADDC